MVELLLAFLLDWVIGDPIYAFHPVRLMGIAIERYEIFLRRIIKNTHFAGTVLALSFPAAVFILASVVLYMCAQIHPILSSVVNILGMYTAISVTDMRKEALRVYKDLHSGNLPEARESLSRIVGRDTKDLPQEEITRAAVETVAESTLDGIVSPLLYAAIGGAPLVLAYKAVNTLDSMVGHLNEKYKEFGYGSAKLDDAFNWLPARLACGFICLAAFLTKLDVRAAFVFGVQQSKTLASISNIPEAAFAGALNVRLGGTNVYEGRVDVKPYLGEPSAEVIPKLITQSVSLMRTSAWVTLVFSLLICFMLG